MAAWLKALQGKKTYILAGVLAVVVLTLVFLGKLTPQVAFGVAMVALGGFAATFRSALAQHQQAVLGVLADVAAAGVAARTHSKAGEEAAAIALASDAAALARPEGQVAGQ